MLNLHRGKKLAGEIRGETGRSLMTTGSKATLRWLGLETWYGMTCDLSLYGSHERAKCWHFNQV